MVSIKVLVMLFSICVLTKNTSAAKPGCCEKYTKDKLPFVAIEGYSVQTMTGICDIDAIIFHTKKGKSPCYDPTFKWVMLYANRLRNKAERVHNNTAQPTQKTSKV